MKRDLFDIVVFPMLSRCPFRNGRPHLDGETSLGLFFTRGALPCQHLLSPPFFQEGLAARNHGLMATANHTMSVG